MEVDGHATVGAHEATTSPKETKAQGWFLIMYCLRSMILGCMIEKLEVL